MAKRYELNDSSWEMIEIQSLRISKRDVHDTTTD